MSPILSLTVRTDTQMLPQIYRRYCAPVQFPWFVFCCVCSASERERERVGREMETRAANLALLAGVVALRCTT
jgi:hypothetical protein